MDIKELVADLHDIREEVINLLFNRYVFRTHQEIVRHNPRLQGPSHGIFSEWAQVLYAQTNSIGVRRLASETSQDRDVNLVRLLDTCIREPGLLWSSIQHYYPQDAKRESKEILRNAQQWPRDWERLARELFGEDRKKVIVAAEKVNRFASKRVAHVVPTVPVNTRFSDLDDAIDVVREITEKYILLVEAEACQSPGKLKQRIDLLEEMKRRKLPKGWDEIFLEPWAKPEIIARPLGETEPPRNAPGG